MPPFIDPNNHTEDDEYDMFMNRIKNFCSLVESDKHLRNLKYYPGLVASNQNDGMRSYAEIGYDDVPNSKFIRVWEKKSTRITDMSVCYFVERTTGNIYGAEGWKKPNFKRQYGTLGTIHDWDWSEYYGVSRKGLDTLVPKSQRRK